MTIRKQSLEFLRNKQTYIRNADPFLTAAQLGYSTYADAAGTAPVDGTGGSPTVTFAVNTSSPISNDADFRFVKDASNRQGQGVATDYTIDNIHLARVLQGSVECQLISGTYATGDIRFYLIETTSGEVIEPVNVQLQLGAVGVTAKHIFTFQTRATNTTYRLCIHVSSTSASAYTIAFNNFRLFEPQQNYGSIITDWTTYSMTIGGSTSAPTKGTTTVDNARWTRVGSDMIIEYDYIQTALGSAANGSGTYLFPLPSGYSIDTTKITSASYNGITAGAVGQAHVTGGSINKGSVNVYNATNLSLNIGNETNIFQAMGSGFQNMAQSTLSIKIVARVPIAGWGSNMSLSSNAGDGREVKMQYLFSSGSTPSTTGGTDGFKAPNKVIDSHAIYNTSTGGISIPVNGMYGFSMASINNVTRNSIFLWRQRNGGSITQIIYMGDIGTQGNMVYAELDCLAGDVVYISGNSGSIALNAVNAFHYISCVRIGSSSQIIAPVETVAASCYLSTNITYSSGNPVVFNEKVIDTHGAVSGTGSPMATANGNDWRFTAPMSGKYAISIMISGSANIKYYIYKATSVLRRIGFTDSQGFTEGSAVINLIAGDYISIRPDASAGAEGGTATGGNTSYIDISRIGI